MMKDDLPSSDQFYLQVQIKQPVAVFGKKKQVCGAVVFDGLQRVNS